jgi:predicted transcriptional regulator
MPDVGASTQGIPDLWHQRYACDALAKALGRDYSNVHADVQALTAAGLLDTADGRVQADYDVIETRIAI